MPSDVMCMALGTVPAGEQRSWFLAVGLADNTVRIISLDPTVSNFFNNITIFLILNDEPNKTHTILKIHDD